jgi:hypothetical protein
MGGKTLSVATPQQHRPFGPERLCVMFIIRRDLKEFGLSIVWDGRMVKVVDSADGRAIEEYSEERHMSAHNLVNGLEARLHADCTACCL